MADSLHRLSSWLFYLLGGSFFVAYLLLENEVTPPWPRFWLSVMDLPLILCAIVYGGTSLYRSLRSPDGSSKILATAITIPLAGLFVFLVVLNFWVLIDNSAPAI